MDEMSIQVHLHEMLYKTEPAHHEKSDLILYDFTAIDWILSFNKNILTWRNNVSMMRLFGSRNNWERTKGG